MGDPKAVILDISSDEEAGCGHGGGSGGGGGNAVIGDGGGNDVNGKSELSHDDDVRKDKDTDDSDDVMVVAEVPVNRKPMIRASLNGVVMASLQREDTEIEDGDDCVVLDGDPNKPVATEKERGEAEGEGVDSDDLVVISEKGQVACRDFPHPRHLCASFPFASTPHETHCQQCHCYVCESLAPCLHWGTGISSIDHCHATEKDEFWKAHRKISMRYDNAPPDVPAVADISSTMTAPLMNQTPQLTSNLLVHNQVLRQATVRPCSVVTSNSMPDVVRQDRTQHPVYVAPRLKFEPYLISQHLNGVSNHAPLRDQRHNNGNMAPGFISPRAMFSGAGSVGAHSTYDGSGYNSSNHNLISQLSTNPPQSARRQYSYSGVTSVSNAYQGSYEPNVGQIANTVISQAGLPSQPILGNGFSNNMPPPGIPSQQNLSSGYANYVQLYPQMTSMQHTSSGYTNYVPETASHQHAAGLFTNAVLPQPLMFYQPHVSGNIGNSYNSGPETASQPLVGGCFANTVPTQPQVTSLYQQNGGRLLEYSESSQSQASRNFQVVNSFRSPVPGQSLISSLPNTGSTFEQLPSTNQSQESSQPTLMPNNSQNSLQQGNQTQVGPRQTFPVSGFSYETYISPSSQQVLADNPQLQSAEPTDNTSVNNAEYPGTTDFIPSELHFDDLFFAQDRISEALDKGLFFDF